ncbi:hypothetical protein G9Q84_11845 [Pseudomonas sp. P7]|uniref:hypothetical protein n=1 Tax=Pseudomonas sivasensis TaxID=1880678 RepID=UPI0015EB5AD1|nr:hypothetical protein [Pseudomonas sivasensis]MBA2923585.1 hypothetical protein [Pseudomonas sivasensis]
MIDSKLLKPGSDAYQATRRAWDSAVSVLSKADAVKTPPLEMQRLHVEAQQTFEALFAAGAQLAEEVADAIVQAERHD